MTNYTSIGFLKTRLSDETYKLVQDFWNEAKANVDNDVVGGMTNESWPTGNTYTNHWSSPSKIISVLHSRDLTEAIYQEGEAKLREWIPQASFFARSDIYGIRVYTEGAILATHIDRDPLISSCIVNVDQDVEEPWPLEVYGHDGRAYNVTMEVSVI
jgi:prolyl 4-hydroxylase